MNPHEDDMGEWAKRRAVDWRAVMREIVSIADNPHVGAESARRKIARLAEEAIRG